MKDDKNLTQTLLKNDVAIIPTDTLYGLVGRALSKKAVEKIYKLKGRKPTKPLIILISSIKDLELFGIQHSHIRKYVRMLKKVWPGAMSVILPCTNKKFEYLHRGTKSLAFRMPDDKKLLALIRKTGPLVAPSANPEGLSPAKNFLEAKKYFGENVSVYIDGGRKIGKPSTLVSLTGDTPIILRQGKTIIKI